MIFSVLEHIIEGLAHGKTIVASVEGMLHQDVNEMMGRALVIFVAFIPFFAFWELGHFVGDKNLFDLFFRKGAGQASG